MGEKRKSLTHNQRAMNRIFVPDFCVSHHERSADHISHWNRLSIWYSPIAFRRAFVSAPAIGINWLIDSHDLAWQQDPPRNHVLFPLQRSIDLSSLWVRHAFDRIHVSPPEAVSAIPSMCFVVSDSERKCNWKWFNSHTYRRRRLTCSARMCMRSMALSWFSVTDFSVASQSSNAFFVRSVDSRSAAHWSVIRFSLSSSRRSSVSHLPISLVNLVFVLCSWHICSVFSFNSSFSCVFNDADNCNLLLIFWYSKFCHSVRCTGSPFNNRNYVRGK